jgi:hypothetical protein
MAWIETGVKEGGKESAGNGGGTGVVNEDDKGQGPEDESGGNHGWCGLKG